MNVRDFVRRAAERLHVAKIENPKLEAEVIAAHVVGSSRARLLAHPETDLPELAAEPLLQKRETGMPLAYVLGKKEFFRREFFVDARVLIPRPETECLVEAVIPRLQSNSRCIDVGTGSGAIAITMRLERRDTSWLACDVSNKALQVASINARRHDAHVSFINGDCVEPLRADSFDAVISNPPYVVPGDKNLDASVEAWEPKEAIFAVDGNSFIRRLIETSDRILRRGGILGFEFGFGQEDAIAHMLAGRRFEIGQDLSGTPRFAVVTK